MAGVDAGRVAEFQARIRLMTDNMIERRQSISRHRISTFKVYNKLVFFGHFSDIELFFFLITEKN